jgi:predicted benzoate:H+ symporter BenE
MQVGIYLVIKFVLFLIFINNPGTVSEFHLVENSYKILLQIWLHPILTGLNWIALAFFVFYHWTEKPDFLKYCLWIYLPLFLLYLLFGNYGELRVFYEVFPIIVLLIAQTISSLAGIKLKPIAESDLTYTTNLVKPNP